MRLLIRRNQRQGGGLLRSSKIIFILDVRAELTPEEAENVSKYGFRDILLYQRLPDDPPAGAGFFAAGAHYAANIELRVSDLTDGKRIELVDFREMLGVEEQVKAAAEIFKALLDRAAGFGGEEILEF